MRYWVRRDGSAWGYGISQWNAHDGVRWGYLRYSHRDGLDIYYTRVEARPHAG